MPKKVKVNSEVRERVLRTAENLKQQLRKQTTMETTEANDSFIRAFLPTVKAVAKEIHATLPVHVNLDDLMQDGLIGLMKAKTKFDSARVDTFVAYARLRIKGAILDGLRNEDYLPREKRRKRKLISSAIEELTKRLERTPSEDEIAKHMALSIEALRNNLTETSVQHVSALTVSPEKDELPMTQFVPDPSSGPDTQLVHKQRREILAQVMVGIPERYQRVIVLRYTSEMKLAKIGDLLGVSEGRVSQMHARALSLMRQRLADKGITQSAFF